MSIVWPSVPRPAPAATGLSHYYKGFSDHAPAGVGFSVGRSENAVA